MLDLEKLNKADDGELYNQCKELTELVGDYSLTYLVLSMITVLPQSSTRPGGNRYQLAKISPYGDVEFCDLIDTAEMKSYLDKYDIKGAYIDRGIRISNEYNNLAKFGGITAWAKETHRNVSNADYYKETKCSYIGITDMFKMLPEDHPLYNCDILKYWRVVDPICELKSKPNKPTADLITINHLGII